MQRALGAFLSHHVIVLYIMSIALIGEKTMNKTLTAMMTAAFTLATLAPVALADSSRYTSNAKVTFEASTDTTDPINPDNPDNQNPAAPENPDGTDPQAPTAGPLSIDFASSLDFGTQKISTTDAIYNAAAQKYSNGTTGTNYVQVTDNRGTDAGWNLSVKQVAQFNDGTNALDGAALLFTNGNLVTNGKGATPSLFSNKFALVPGTATSIVDAAAGQGQGTWAERFGDTATADSSIQLSVPGSTTKRANQYTSTLEWTLAQAPTGSVN